MEHDRKLTVVVLGAAGMLGHDLVSELERSGISATGLDLPGTDITRAGFEHDVPHCDWIVNCAAYTQVDKAESEKGVAHAVNVVGARNVARLAAARGIPLLHMSTDYVFDGTSTSDYTENDPTNPLGAYGATKLAGEIAVREEECRALVVRTQSLFGLHGHNFVKTVMRLLDGGEPLRIVNDQTMSPTYTAHLAEALVALITAGADGTVHVSASGKCTWYDFALSIRTHVGADNDIQAITTDELGLPAPRPAYSVLDNSRYESLTGMNMPAWEQGLTDYMSALAAQPNR